MPLHPATRFALVGCTNFVVSFSVFFLTFNYLPEPMRSQLPMASVANVAAYAAGMINSFVLNRSWTFRAGGNAAAQALRFAVVNLATLALSTATMFQFVDVRGYPELAIWVPTTIIVMALNYLGCKYWAFAPQPWPSGKSA
jgi:putative flippase GtrA